MKFQIILSGSTAGNTDLKKNWMCDTNFCSQHLKIVLIDLEKFYLKDSITNVEFYDSLNMTIIFGVFYKLKLVLFFQVSV